MTNNADSAIISKPPLAIGGFSFLTLKEEKLMENIIFELEQKMWNAAAGRDKEAFLQLVSLEAVMVCGGFRCSGADYAELIKDFGISSYEITNFETVAKTEQLVQVCYIVKTAADSPETADLAGMFHITSTWAKKNGTWKLIFNMDQRIFDE